MKKKSEKECCSKCRGMAKCLNCGFTGTQVSSKGQEGDCINCLGTGEVEICKNPSCPSCHTPKPEVGQREEECHLLTDHCSGCTDPRSEGTHQGCTIEHGHVGCSYVDSRTPEERANEPETITTTASAESKEKTEWVKWIQGIAYYHEDHVDFLLASQKQEWKGKVENMMRNSPDAEKTVFLRDGTPVPKGNSAEDSYYNLALIHVLSILDETNGK